MRKRCPFCGSDETRFIRCCGTTWVSCEKCEASGPEGKDEKEAIALWNARFQDIPETVDMLLEFQECAYYWSEYDVPIGIKERLDEVIERTRTCPVT